MITLTKRQYTETRKRHEATIDLLSEKFNTTNAGIDLEHGYIYFGESETIAGYFWNYKELKQLQDQFIANLKNLDRITSSEEIARRVEYIRRNKR
jgi:hypothetical protein